MRRTIEYVAAIVGALALVLSVAAATAPSEAPAKLFAWKLLPVGVTLSDLQHYVLTPGSIRSIDAKMLKAKSEGANTIRIQGMQDRMTGRYGHHYDAAYMADLEAVVSYGRSLGLTMVINDQTEPAPHFGANEGMPTHATHVFWADMLKVYANVPGVEFDLFNEPRHASWQTWRVTFQRLVNFIRRHAGNTIWLEGERYASTLQHQPRIYGRNVVLTFHHPGAPWPHEVRNNAWTWDKSFGRLAATGTPVVDGEFTNNKHTYHLPGKTIRAYFKYARQHHIGLLVFGTSFKLLNEYERA